jgi:hypothetical protein
MLVCFGEPGGEIVDDVGEPAFLGGVGAEHGARMQACSCMQGVP